MYYTYTCVYDLNASGAPRRLGCRGRRGSLRRTAVRRGGPLRPPERSRNRATADRNSLARVRAGEKWLKPRELTAHPRPGRHGVSTEKQLSARRVFQQFGISILVRHGERGC